MPGRGKRGNGRGRGQSNGRGRGRGRGRGYGSGGGGGRGRNRELIPSTIGYVYRPRSNVDEFDDDFRVYGQFGTDEEDSEDESRQLNDTKKWHNKRNKKVMGKFVRESRPSLGSTYGDRYDDDEESRSFAGLGSTSSSRQTDTAAGSSPKFAQGKSKYFKTVLFTKSSSSIDLAKDAELVVQETQVVTQEETTTTTTPEPSAAVTVLEKTIAQLTLDNAVIAEKERARTDLLNLLAESSKSTDTATAEIYEYTDLVEADDDTSSKVKDQAESSSHSPETRDAKAQESEDDDTSYDEYDEQGQNEDFDSFLDESEDDDDDDEDEDILSDTDEDELLEEDMLIMEDYIENVELEEGEDLNDLMAWSAMQDENLEVEILPKKGKNTLSGVEEDTRRKVGHRTRDDKAVVDPEIFGETLRAALADVPPGLRPGMRRWYEKQQRKEDRKKKMEEAKIHRKEKKLKGKGKANDVQEQQLSVQMAKIDERLRDFVQDTTITSFQFAPMETNARRQLHVLAAAYKMKSKSTGSGGSRCTVVTKTPSTNIPRDTRYISRFLSDIQNNMDEQNRIIGKNRSKGTQKGKGKKKFVNSSKKNSGSSTPKDRQAPSAGPSHGTIVAFDAAPIGESNIGHRMLAAMGWKQGDALGSKNDGIVAPIEAIIRRKNRGLGS